jgi:hypothetical protein
VNLRLKALTAAEAIEIGGWRYDPPYDTYNVPHGRGHRISRWRGVG